MTEDKNVNPKPSVTTTSTAENEIDKLKRDVQISILREELKQHSLPRVIRIGLAVFIAIYLLILVSLLTRETSDSLYLVQALGLKILGTLLAIGILAALYHRLSSGGDN